MDLPISVVPPRGLALASGLPESLHTRVRGAGWEILLMQFGNRAHFQLDLTERDMHDFANSKLVIREDDLAHAAAFPSNVKLVKVEPDSLELVFGGVFRKRMTVVPRIDISVAPGYAIVGEPTVTPEFTVVQGTHAILDPITYFPTKTVTKRDLRESIDETVELSDTLGSQVTLGTNSVFKVHVNIEAIAERVFSNVPIEVEAVPPEKEVLLIPNDVSVTLRGGVNQLSKILPAAFHARVTYQSVLFDTASSVRPEVDIPAGTTFLASDPERVRFVVRKRADTTHAIK